MKSYAFALPDDEAAALDLTILQMTRLYPDLNPDDALIAILRLGWDQARHKMRQTEAAG